MELGIWDTAMIAGWVVVWLMGFTLVISFFVGFSKRRKERKEILQKFYESAKTDEKFTKIVSSLDEDGETK
jgi:hypothetical protein